MDRDKIFHYPGVPGESTKVHLERTHSCLRASLAKCYGCVFAKIKTPGSVYGSPGVLGRMSLVRNWAERGCIPRQLLWVKNTWHLFFPRQGNTRTLLHHLKGNWFWRSRISLFSSCLVLLETFRASRWMALRVVKFLRIWWEDKEKWGKIKMEASLFFQNFSQTLSPCVNFIT